MQKSVKKYCHDCFLCYNDNRHSREGGIEFYSNNRLYIMIIVGDWNGKY